MNGLYQNLSNYDVEVLSVRSHALKSNRLRDPHVRHSPVLVPKTLSSKTPVVFFLSGFTGNGPQHLNLKFGELNLTQSLDTSAEGRRNLPLVVLVEAQTFWGGSQFLNSYSCGRYEDYIVGELADQLGQKFKCAPPGIRWAVAGSSSGGYGALHLGSRHPNIFSYVAALAPDSFFEQSLLPEFFKAAPHVQSWGGIRGVASLLKKHDLMSRPSAHTVVNAIAMAACYCKGPVEFPMDLQTGQLKPKIWKNFLENDPLNFLKRRGHNIRKVKAWYLDVGKKDQFHLQFGTRQIVALLKARGGRVHHSEFDGHHFDLSRRRPELWRWLFSRWS